MRTIVFLLEALAACLTAYFVWEGCVYCHECKKARREDEK